MELDECAAILYVKDKDSKEEEIKEEYYILKKIGLGGTSIVYLCQSSLDGHEYALKLYSNIDAYQTETQLLRLIQSSNNIVKLIKSGEGILERGNSLDNASVADFIGKNIPTSHLEGIRVCLTETDGIDEVVILRPDEKNT